MERQASLHPADETLVSYGLGKLDETVADSVSQHLEACVPCQRRVAELSSDSFVGRLRDAQIPQPDRLARPKTPADAESAKPASVAAKPSSAINPPDSKASLLPELSHHPHYDVIRELGRGGMGVVYLARNKLMDRLEVLKILNKEMLAKPGTADRFLREIQSAAKLHHPNVVAAYTALPMGDLLVFAMEYVEGDDLAKLVRARGPLPVVNACYFTSQAAHGLQHAHERGMIHRDIKPGNLILFRQGKKAVVKILDFGLAKVTSERGIDKTLTQQGQMLGTPDYIAPEQTLDAQKADIRSDIYSLGCTLYHLLAGNPPFAGNSLYEVLQSHQTVEARSLNLVRPEVPAELAAVVTKMMAKDPSRRYQTPGAVVLALKPFLKPAASAAAQPEFFQLAPQAVGPAAGSSDQSAPVDDDAPALMPMHAPNPAERWKSLIDLASLERKSAFRSGVRKPGPKQPWWMWTSVAIAAMSLGLVIAWAAGVFTLNTKNGTIVIENLPDQAAVFVDGEVVTVQPAGDNRAADIIVRTGKHRVDVKRGDVTVSGEDVTIAAGERKPIRVSLAPLLPNTAANLGAVEKPKSLGRPVFIRGEWTIDKDELVQSSLGVRQSTPILVFGDESLSNYDMTVDVKKTGGAETTGVIFHWLGPRHHCLFCLSKNHELDLRSIYDGRLISHEGNLKSWNYGSNQWYTLKVEVRGESCRSFVDNEFQAETTDARFDHGRVCLWTRNATARFRRIKVTDPQGKVLLEGLPDLPAIDKSATGTNAQSDPPPLTQGEVAAQNAQRQSALESKAPIVSSNSLGMKLALIPPGKFQMGSPDSEEGRDAKNEEQHFVTIANPFRLGVFEVTQDEFERVKVFNPSRFSNSAGESERTSGVDTRRYPVENVTWFDAIDFCNALSEKEGIPSYYALDGVERESNESIKNATVTVKGANGYRLPTEVEWEYACRAGTTTPFHFGSVCNGHQCNCDGKQPYGTEEKGPSLGCTTTVGRYRPNAFGVYDMHGNVGEWCEDWFTPNIASLPASLMNGPLSGTERVSRGGICFFGGGGVRSGLRDKLEPRAHWQDRGFRVALGMPSRNIASESANAADRKNFNIEGGHWCIDGDELVQNDPKALTSVIIFGDDKWTDYDFTVDVERTDGANSCSLFFRTADQANRLSFVAGGDLNRKAFGEIVNAGRIDRVEEREFKLFDYRWCTFRVRCRGNRFECFGNDGRNEVKLAEWEDARHGHGRVGLQTWYAAFRFKNIKVTAADGKILWEGLPEIRSLSTNDSTPSGGATVPDNKAAANRSQRIPRELIAASDPLAVGSVWKGRRTYERGVFSVNTVSYELHVDERTGSRFKGHVFDNGQDRNRAEIQGEISGEAITWRERQSDRTDQQLVMTGHLRGNAIELRFKGHYGNAACEGIGELACQP